MRARNIARVHVAQRSCDSPQRACIPRNENEVPADVAVVRILFLLYVSFFVFEWESTLCSTVPPGNKANITIKGYGMLEHIKSLAGHNVSEIATVLRIYNYLGKKLLLSWTLYSSNIGEA